MTASDARSLVDQWLRGSWWSLLAATAAFIPIGVGLVRSWLLFVVGVAFTIIYFVLLSAVSTMNDRISSGEFHEEDQATRDTR